MFCELNNFFVNFSLSWDQGINLTLLKEYLGEYASIERVTNLSGQYDLSICFIDENNRLFDTNVYMIDNHKVKVVNNQLFIGRKELNSDEILFTKRLLIDLINRFFECKGGIFLHSSSVVFEGNTILFIGDKGAGKTTNMLYLLNNFNLAYSSNERTGLILKDDKIISYGNPARINIRANTLKSSESLKDKLWDSIDKTKYQQYITTNLSRDCSERLVISFKELANRLGIKIVPNSKLKIIFNLIYKPDIEFDYEEVRYEEIKSSIDNSIIDGVFPQREILNKIFPIGVTTIKYILDSNEICYYNIYQDDTRDNSPEIYKILKRKM